MHAVGTAFPDCGHLAGFRCHQRKLREKIIANQLVTAVFMHGQETPIYSAFAFVMSGAALSNSFYLYHYPLCFGRF